MTAIMTGPEVPAAIKCKIDEVFASPFIELIGLAPRNPVVRGLILAQTGRMPGPERGTFAEIKEWVETTCDKKLRPADPEDGYGSMQVHNHDARQTLFAINHWREGTHADIGIGNQPKDNPDWTFAGNAGGFRAMRLRVLVHYR